MELYERSMGRLTEAEYEVLSNLLLKYEDVWENAIWIVLATQHHIHTDDAVPVRMRMTRTPQGFQKEENTLLLLYST